MRAKEIQKERKFKAGFVIRWELIDGSEYGGDDTVMRSAYTLNGDYIGDWKTAYRLCTKRGIKPELRTDTSNVCSIGWCEQEGKWYGWSHRAIYGFKIGSTVKKGDVAYVPSTVDELYDAELDYGTRAGGIERLLDGIRIKHDMVTYTDENPLTGELTNPVPAPPEYHIIKIGKGDWVARSLKDAKQMAMDFAEGVA